MNHHLLWALLSLWVAGALGNLLAAPYQAMFVWYAYRMDVNAFGAGNTVIAPGCFGHGPGDTCLFDELLHYISDNGDSKSTGSTSVGWNLTPDIDVAGAELSYQNYDDHMNSKKLLPSWKPKKVLMGPLITELANVIQLSCQALNDDSVQELAKAREALSRVHALRAYQDGGVLIQRANQAIKDAGKKWQVEIKTTFTAGGSYQELDAEKTLRNHPEDKAVIDALNQAVEEFQTGAKDPMDHNHYRATTALQGLCSRILSVDRC